MTTNNIIPLHKFEKQFTKLIILKLIKLISPTTTKITNIKICLSLPLLSPIFRKTIVNYFFKIFNCIAFSELNLVKSSYKKLLCLYMKT